jgi:hypothetical protein
VLLFVLYPLVGGSMVGDWILDIFFLSVLLAGAYAASGNRRTFLIAFASALVAVLSTLALYVHRTPALEFLSLASFAFFFVVIILDILAFILRSERVTADIIFASVSAYLLIGFLWSFFYILVEYLNPGSFSIPAFDALEGASSPRYRYDHLSYFSFVTLTSLGYGDITPLGHGTRSLAVLEAVTGQMYVAVLIARLVALHIVHAGKGEKTD